MALEEDEDDALNFCYVEGSERDTTLIEEPTELHEEVWYRMKPPKRSNTIYQPFVTARQIEITRTLLSGKNAPKLEMKEMPSKELPAKPQASLKKKKSAVRFLSSTFMDEGYFY